MCFQSLFSGEGKRLFAISHATIKLWDIETGEALRVFGGDGLRKYSVATHPAGNLFAFGREDATLVVAHSILEQALAELRAQPLKPGNLFEYELNAKVGSQYVIQTSVDLLEWSDSQNGTVVSSPLRLNAMIGTNETGRFFRARTQAQP